MFSRFRDHFGAASLIVAVVALIAALTGGAFAATGGAGDSKAVASAKGKGKPGPRGKQGVAGPQGPAGPAGPAGSGGAKGDTGAAGANGPAGPTGPAGAAGKTVLHGVGAPTGGIGTVGDFYINTTTDEIFGPKVGVGTWGSGTALKGDPGANGSPWVVGTAPQGVTLKGTWSIQQYTAAGAGDVIPTPISTGVPINTLSGFFVVLKQGENLPGQSSEEREEAEGFCPGNAENALPPAPTASFISTCVYIQEATNLVGLAGSSLLNGSGGGIVAPFQSFAAGETKGYGSWSLVAP